MAAHDKQVRVLTSRIGGYARWREVDDRRAATKKARTASWNRFRDQARRRWPDLSEAEIEKRAESLRGEHFTRMALKSVQVRQERAAKRKQKAAGKPRTEITPHCECGVELGNEASRTAGKCFRCRKAEA